MSEQWEAISTDPVACQAIVDALENDPDLIKGDGLKDVAGLLATIQKMIQKEKRPLGQLAFLAVRMTNVTATAFLRRTVLEKLDGLRPDDPAGAVKIAQALAGLRNKWFAKILGWSEADLDQAVAIVNEAAAGYARNTMLLETGVDPGRIAQLDAAVTAKFTTGMNTLESRMAALNGATMAGRMMKGLVAAMGIYIYTWGSLQATIAQPDVEKAARTGAMGALASIRTFDLLVSLGVSPTSKVGRYAAAKLGHVPGVGRLAAKLAGVPGVSRLVGGKFAAKLATVPIADVYLEIYALLEAVKGGKAAFAGDVVQAVLSGVAAGAVLGRVSPSLEFMLRLLRSVPGISEDEAAAFFGYSSAEREYVLLEATAPAYVDRIDGRLWLTSAGDALFNIGEEEPSIYEVLPRHGSVGFDLLALAPQRPQGLDIVERFLPELGIEDGEAIGKASESVRGRFRRFFHELGDRRDREQFHRRDLYSIGPVVPGDRFQAPVRIKVETLASSPSVPEVDLNSWRPDNEIADRAQIEQAAGRFVEELRVAKHTANDAGAYQAMLDLAPDFFKEFTTRAGLSVTRYWREAITRVGEARIDRPTIAIVGPFYTQANAERLLSILDYGLRAHGQQKPPEILLSVAPQVKHWGATTQLRDILA
jgi:hypothetical protein